MSASDTPIHPREGLPARVLFSEWGNAPARDAGRTRRPIAKRSDPKHRGYPSLDRVPLIRNLNNESSIVDAAWAENIDQFVILETPPSPREDTRKNRSNIHRQILNKIVPQFSRSSEHKVYNYPRSRKSPLYSSSLFITLPDTDMYMKCPTWHGALTELRVPSNGTFWVT